MLRASAQATGQQFDLRAITDRADDPLVPVGKQLLGFVTSLLGDDVVALTEARDLLLRDAGPDVVVRAAAVAGNFEMMNRLVDATGVPIGASIRAIAADLAIAEPT